LVAPRAAGAAPVFRGVPSRRIPGRGTGTPCSRRRGSGSAASVNSVRTTTFVEGKADPFSGPVRRDLDIAPARPPM
jgi:hypothetical protein